MNRVSVHFITVLVALVAATALIDGASAARADKPDAANAVAGVSIDDPLDWVGQLDRVPSVDLKAMHGHGAVAVRQGHSLYIADGDAPPEGTFHRIENHAIVRAMAWSHDGRYLAFASRDALWILARNATDGNQIALPANSGFTFSWSPQADVLALNVSPFLGTPPDYEKLRAPDSSLQRIVTRCGTALVRPDGTTGLALDACPERIRWSTDGKTIAHYAFGAIEPYTKWTSARDGIYTAEPGGRETLRATSTAGGQLALAAFVPSHDALLLWSGTERSASISADGQDLMLLTSESGPRKIGFGLAHPFWQTFSDDGSRLVFVSGRSREAWVGKSLVLCTIAGRCRTLPHAAGTIGLDPRWRPGSTATIAFVQSNDLAADGGYAGNFLTKWLRTRTLWIQDVDTGNARSLPAFGSGIFCPRWSNDGTELMAYRNGAMLIGPPDGSKAKPVVTGLPRPDEFEDAFMGDHGAFNDCPVAWTGE